MRPVSVDHLVPEIYAAAFGKQSWDVVVDGIRTTTCAHAASLSLVDPHDGVAERVERGLDADWLDHHVKHFDPDPWTRILLRCMPGQRFFSSDQLQTHRDYVPDPEFTRHCELQDVHHTAGAHTDYGDGFRIRVSLQRDRRRGTFTAAQLRPLDGLLAHVTHALELARPADTLPRWDHFSRTAAFLVGRTLRVIRRNGASDAVLQPRGPLRLRQGRLTVSDPVGSRTLRTQVDAVLEGAQDSGRPFVLQPARPDSPRLVACVAPDAPGADRFATRFGARAALLTISRSDAPEGLDARLLQTHFQLTPTEIRVACTLAAGNDVETTATRLGMNGATVRWHLKHVYAKTGTRGQLELAVLFQTLAHAGL